MTPGPNWAHVSAGYRQTCAIRDDTTLWCWGDNGLGQLGIGSHGPTGQDLPRQVTTPAAGGWANVSGGDNLTCATRTNGTLWCWGYDHFGELGIGSHTDQDLPRQVTFPRPGGWASIAAGDLYTCATRTDATLWCWGDSGYGQLGTGDHTNRYRPHQVTTPALGGWASVAADVDHTCATRTGATLWCWGASGDGSLGIGHIPNQNLPQQVRTPAPAGWASITAGHGQTCAIRTDATLWCWGFNGYGQLGTGNYTSQWRRQQVTGCRQMTLSPPAPYASIAAALRHHARRPERPLRTIMNS